MTKLLKMFLIHLVPLCTKFLFLKLSCYVTLLCIYLQSVSLSVFCGRINVFIMCKHERRTDKPCFPSDDGYEIVLECSLRAALISVSVALNQTPAYTAKHSCSARAKRTLFSAKSARTLAHFIM